jgi:hypothetical protein
MLVRPRILDVAFELTTGLVRCPLRSIKQDFGRFVAAQGDMRSELWVCALARAGDPCGRRRVHRDTACQQLRLLVRDRRLHHARGLEDLAGLPALLTVFPG